MICRSNRSFSACSLVYNPVWALAASRAVINWTTSSAYLYVCAGCLALVAFLVNLWHYGRMIACVFEIISSWSLVHFHFFIYTSIKFSRSIFFWYDRSLRFVCWWWLYHILLTFYFVWIPVRALTLLRAVVHCVTSGTSSSVGASCLTAVALRGHYSHWNCIL